MSGKKSDLGLLFLLRTVPPNTFVQIWYTFYISGISASLTGPVCYSCDKTLDPSHCTTSAQCSRDQVNVLQKVKGGNQLELDGYIFRGGIN